MPTRHFWTFVEQMPVLQARESVMRINEVAYAFGSFSKEDGETFMHELKVQATAPDQPLVTAQRPQSAEELMRLAGPSTQVEPHAS
jgi:hypothetical protein